MIAAWVLNPRSGGEMGVIGDTRTAIRDPYFWHWHKHIDQLAFRLQEQHDEHRFDDAPDVTIRGAELCVFDRPNGPLA